MFSISGYKDEFSHCFYIVTKRFLDIFLSIFGLCVFSPLIVVIMLIIKVSSRGPCFYKQVRVGKEGKLFVLYKFRSMIQEAEKTSGPVFAARGHDPRVTRFGFFLRRSGLDEIPQLVNVLRGEMSMVGPRPERPHFIREYPFLNGPRLSVAPGGTGLELLFMGTSDFAIEDYSIEKKVELDLLYIKNRTFLLDLRIIIKTMLIVLTRIRESEITKYINET